jgi:hypothetical protein
MRAGAIIYPILSSFSNLTSLVAASNIFAVRASQGTNAPYIVYREISNTPTNTKGTGDGTADPKINQRSILDVSTIQISIFANTYLELDNIAVAVRQALDREWGSVPSPYNTDISLDSCIFDSMVDDYDDDFGDHGIYIKHMDFTLRINRINISN